MLDSIFRRQYGEEIVSANTKRHWVCVWNAVYADSVK